MEWSPIDMIRPWAEILYFASGAILAVVALYGAQQVRLLKKDIRDRAERAAQEKAIEFASRYLSRYTRFDKRVSNRRDEKGLSGYNGPVGSFEWGSIPSAEMPLSLKRMEIVEYLWAFNELECIASAFVTGVASEQTGFRIFGRSYCAAVATNYDVLTLLRGAHVAAHHFSSIVALYGLWAPRLSKAELEEARKRLDERISGIRTQVAPSLGLGRKSGV